MKKYLNYINESVNQLDELIHKCTLEGYYKPLSVLDKEYVMKYILNNFSIDNLNFEELIKYDFPLNTKNSDGDTALILTLIKNNKELFKLLIDDGANVNIKYRNGNTALMLASARNKLDFVKLLIDAGANVNLKNICGDTALFLSHCGNNKEIIELLKSKGAK